MQLPAGAPAARPRRPSSRPTGTPSDAQLRRRAEVGQHEHADRVAAGGHPARRADAALPAEADHAGAGAHRPLGATGPPRPRASARPRRPPPPGPRARRSASCRRTRPTTGITTSSTPTAGSAATAAATAPSYTRPTAIVAVRYTGVSSTPHSRICSEAGHLPRAVEHRHAGGNGLGPERRRLGRQDRGDAGAGDAAAGRRVGLVAPRPSRGRRARRHVGDRASPGRARARRCEGRARGGCGPGPYGADPTCRIRSRRVGPSRCPSCGATATACTSPGGEVWVGVRIPGTELPARAERIRERARGAAARASCDAEPQPDDAVTSGARPRAVELPRERMGRLGGGRARPEDPGQDRVVPYLFPHPGLFGGGQRPRAGRDLGPGRAVRLRHDDAHRPGHLGGGAGRARRRGHRRRPRTRRRARRLRVLPPARPSRDAHLLRRLLLPQQRRGRGRAPARRGAQPGRGARRRRAPRQRHAGDLLRRPGGAHRLGARGPRRGLVPALPGLRRRDGGRRRRRQPQRDRSRPAPATRAGRRPSSGLAAWAGDGARRRWWSRSAWTPPAAIRRARST